MVDAHSIQSRAKKYASIKYSLAIVDLIYLLSLLFLFQGLGLSLLLAKALSQLLRNNFFMVQESIKHFPIPLRKSLKVIAEGDFLVIPTYVALGYIAYYILDFPLNFYQSFILEHKFSLSEQKIRDWFKDQVKAGIISYVIAFILVVTFYYILGRYQNTRWLIISLFWIFFSLILAKLTPILIIPLFFKYKKFSDEALRERILNLAKKMQVKILDVFEIDFSKKTLKANAAFVGVGNTKRVILADTLKDKYTYDEIEVILAHEFAHYRLRHLLKLIFVNSVFTIICFYLIFKTSGFALNLFGLSTLSDIAALPVVLIYFALFAIIMEPFGNFISRRLERNADLLALKTTGLKEAFISMMEKLATQNLADRNPHPVIKFFFFDHPPIEERIALAK